MMKALLTAGLLLCLATAPANADQADCRADLAALRAAFGGSHPSHIIADRFPTMEPVEEDGRCVLRNLAMQTDDSVSTFILVPEAQEIVWRSTWADGVRSGMPLSLVLDIRGAKMVNHIQDADEFSLQMRLIAELNSSSLHLDYAFDPATKRLVLTSLDLADARGNRLSLSGVIENFDHTALTDEPPQLDRVMQFRLMDLDLKLRNASVFEQMTMVWLSAIYPQLGDTPEAAVNNARAWLIEQVGGLPDYLVTQDSREVIVAMVDTLPHPKGVMHLTLSAEDGIAGEDVMPAFLLGQPTWEMLERPLTGVRLKADWQPPKDCNCGDW